MRYKSIEGQQKGKKQLQIDIPVMVSRKCEDISCNESHSANFVKVPLSSLSNSMVNSQTYASRQMVQSYDGKIPGGGIGKQLFSPQVQNNIKISGNEFFSPNTVGPTMLFTKDALRDSTSFGAADDNTARVQMASVQKRPSQTKPATQSKKQSSQNFNTVMSPMSGNNEGFKQHVPGPLRKISTRNVTAQPSNNNVLSPKTSTRLSELDSIKMNTKQFLGSCDKLRKEYKQHRNQFKRYYRDYKVSVNKLRKIIPDLKEEK